MLPPYVWPNWELFMEPVTAIGETLAMAFLGTLLASLVALPLSFLGAKNILRVEWLRFGVRRGFDTLRAFEQLVLALIFIRAFGLGPLAGIFAIMVSDIGSLSKLFAEAIENIDRKQVEGVRASGGGPLQVIRLAILPQVLPVMLSNALYYLESNTRSASILGIVGAGGIGYLLYDRMAANNWDEVMSIIILILITVYAIDTLSGWLRGRIIGKSDYRP
jgi:phosphonate transport system permease protein